MPNALQKAKDNSRASLDILANNGTIPSDQFKALITDLQLVKGENKSIAYGMANQTAQKFKKIQTTPVIHTR